MSASSAAHVLEAHQRNEYPFPVVNAVEPSSSSSSGTLPRSRNTHTRSSASSSRHNRYVERDRDREHVGSSTKYLSRLTSREDRDIKHMRALLVLTTDRLEGETRRADQAEQRVVDALHRLRAANEATVLARTDAARTSQEVSLYKLQLQNAQNEIRRAQEIVDQLVQEKADAEAEAARARTSARRWREDHLVTKAREEGRQQGFKEGYSRGKGLGFYERQESRRVPLRPVMNDPPSEDEEMEPVRSRTPASPPILQISPATPYAPRPLIAERSPLLQSNQRSPPPSHVPDAAPFGPSLPIPTVVTPMNLPSPFHEQPTPSPVPIPYPHFRRSQNDPTPIPIHNVAPSPNHPPVEIPPDNWIPYANGNQRMEIPPPHEFSRPVTPRSPSPSLPEAPPSQPVVLSSRGVESTIRSRDYAYSDRAEFINVERAPPQVPNTPQSRTSTRISQYDLVAPSRHPMVSDQRSLQSTFTSSRQGGSTASSSMVGIDRPYTPAGPSRMNSETRSPRGPRLHGMLRSPAPAAPAAGRTTPKQKSGGSKSPLEKLFKNRFRSRTSNEGTPGVPTIFVESPSTPASLHTPSSERTAMHPAQQNHDFLSPEHANRPLPVPAPEPVTVMRVEAPLYHPSSMDDDRPFSPLSAPSLPLLPGDQMPPGFVPTGFTPSPRLPEMQGFPDLPPLAGDRYLSRSPKSSVLSYTEAPISSNVAYPEPPVRSSTPYKPAAGVPSSSSSASQSRTSPRRRRDSSSLRLSPLSLGRPFASFTASDE